MKLALSDAFQLIIVDEEADETAEEDASGYEPIVADPARLDMRWLAEEQALLSIPLVPKHEDVNCAGVPLADEAGGESISSQRPFSDLKKLLRDR